MKTEDLITALAADAPPVDPRRVARRFTLVTLAGLPIALVAVLALLGPRHDLAVAMGLPMFWVKLAFPLAIGASAWLLLRRLGSPGARAGGTLAGVVLPVLLMWLLAAAVLLSAPAGERLPLVLGATWRQCPAFITLLALPAGALAFGALRGLAPTRLVPAGAAAGLFAGAVGAAAYSVHCPELQAPFLGVWYLLGMLVPAALGAALGPRVLRW